MLLGDGHGGLGRKHSYDTGSTDMADAADLNGDDKLDLVTGSADEDEIAVQLNRGNGSFQHRHAYAIGGAVSSFDIGDVNGDGDRDIVTVQGAEENYDEDDENDDEDGSGTVSVFLNNGDGSFKPGRDYDLAQDPDECFLGDLNRDGRADLVVTNDYDDTVTVILNHNGGFNEERDYAVDGTRGIEIHDMNGDGRPDLVAMGELLLRRLGKRRRLRPPQPWRRDLSSEAGLRNRRVARRTRDRRPGRRRPSRHRHGQHATPAMSLSSSTTARAASGRSAISRPQTAPRSSPCPT